ncbi:MAG: 50S ribosomal protein L29 [bacterium]|nr:50S ribosomal protein L29 [bacterium]
MKVSELQQKNKTELREILSDLQIKLGKLRFELSANTLKDSSQVKKVKKDMARVLTILRNHY